MYTVAARHAAVRPLAPADLDAVVAIDALAEGWPRRPYFERRLATAQREPARHVQYAVADDEALTGYLLARVLDGEFGQGTQSLSIEAIGARHDAKGTGIGRRLLAALHDAARRRGIAELRTQAAWHDHRMLRWLDENGFALAANHIIDCAVAAFRDGDASAGVPDAGLPAEPRYGATPSNDFVHLARDNVEIDAMDASDLPDVARIDRLITGTERYDYMRRKLAEAMLDSAIRVSLTARVDAHVVGFVTARVDLGNFGRTEPVAELDTIGVHPDYGHRRIGHALMSQLVVNLAALRIERIETMVAPHDLTLLGFLYDVGFAPSQRIPFVRCIV